MGRPCRLLAVTAYADLGGGETALLSVLTALDPARVQPHLMTRAEGQLSEAARALGVPVDVLRYHGAPVWFVPAIWARLPAARRLARRIRDLSPDVVLSDFHTLPYAASACHASGVPLVFLCWGWWFRPRAWQRGLYRRRIHTIVAASHAVKRGFLGRSPVVPPETIPVLHPGVDAERFRPQPHEVTAIREDLDLPTDGPLVTLLARFQRVKGHDVFLASARQILRTHPDATFAVAGEHIFGQRADGAYKRRVLSEAHADSGLRSRVRFLGWRGDPERLLAASDVIVCSSRFETLGMAAIEAMSCGVPVVSTDVGGPRETIIEGVTGHLVAPERPDLIADRVRMLLDDEARRRTMGEAGRAHVIAHFSLAGYARRVEDIALKAAGVA